MVDKYRIRMVSFLAVNADKLRKADDSQVEKMEKIIRELDLDKLRKAGKDNEKRKAGSTDFESEAMGLKAEIVKVERAIRQNETTDAIHNALTRDIAPNVYTDYFTKRLSTRRTACPDKRLAILQRGLKALRTRVKNLEAKLAIAAPDESLSLIHI